MGKIQRTKKVAVYTREDLRRVYEHIVRYSQQCYRKEEIENCLKCIDAAALLQYNLNDRYTDDRLNDLIRTISHSAFEQRLVDADARTVCFIDRDCREILKRS